MTAPELFGLLADRLADTETGWSLGSFGLIAEFTRDADETATLDLTDSTVSAVTARGGIRIQAHGDMRLIASESPTTESWNHRVALCLPQRSCAMNGRSVVTELDSDRDALRARDREAILFDLGLRALQIDACVRSGDPAVIAALREWVGKPLFAPGNGIMGVILASNPHRVFQSHLGRIEVFQPIPPSNGQSPTGPHTHVLPKLLVRGLTHSANEPLPLGWVPCAHFYPPHPLKDELGRQRAFQREYHLAFQDLLASFGDPQLVALKRRVIHAVMAGRNPTAGAVPGNRFARGTVRVALRQMRASDKLTTALAAWLSAYDRYEPGETVESPEPQH